MWVIAEIIILMNVQILLILIKEGSTFCNQKILKGKL